MPYSIDTNILLRLAEPNTDACRIASDAIRNLRLAGETLVVASQNIVEFWTVATRPTSVNGLGMTVHEALTEVQAIQRLFPVLRETQFSHDVWLKIVVTHGVSGVRTHDARLAAALRVNGISHILTFNVADFDSFGTPVAVHPIDIK